MFDRDRVVRTYDDRFSSDLHERFFEHSGFSNLGHWDGRTLTGREAAGNLVDRLLALIPVRQGAILDVACGQGGSTRQLLAHYPAPNITAINISARQLAEAARRAPGCRFALMDACDLRFPDQSFDAVLCVEAAFHFDTRARFLAEAHRVLKPGGRLALSDILFRARMPIRDVPTANRVTIDAYKDTLQHLGFREVALQDVTPDTWRAFDPRFRRFAHDYLKRFPLAFRWRAGIGLGAWHAWMRLGIRRYVLVAATR